MDNALNNDENEKEEEKTEILEDTSNEETEVEQIQDNTEIVQEKSEPNSGECWALVCYTEKTFFQKIVYNFKKLFNYTKNRILGKA